MQKNITPKPKKPYPDFPLFPHATGRWAKKIKGKTIYFGPWADPDAALAKYLDQRDDLQAGRTHKDASGGLTVRELHNRYLTAKRHLVDTRELSAKTFDGYHASARLVVAFFGKGRAVVDLRPDDFDRLRVSFARTRGPVALGNEVRRTRGAFKFAYDAGLIAAPIRFGPTFKVLGKRIFRQTAGPRMFDAPDLRRIIEASRHPIRSRRYVRKTPLNRGAAVTHPMRAFVLPRGQLGIQSD